MAEIKGVAAGWNEHLASLPGARKTRYEPSSMPGKFGTEDWTYDSAYDMVHRGADTGRGLMDEAIEAARNSGDAAQQGAATMRQDAQSMRQQAQLVNTQANAINTSADALQALVPQLDPYKDKFDNYGGELDALAAIIQGRADDVFGQGKALVTLDPNAGGLAGEWMNQYSLLSPERYVSRMASDAQASIDNTRAQTERYLARRGVSVGSGANAGLMNNLQRVKEAAVLAAAKSLGYDKGVTEQNSFLGQMTNAAKTLYDMGTQQQSQALAAKGAAADMAAKGAGIVAQQGGLIQNAAQIRQQAGQLLVQGANLFGSAAGVEGNAANLDRSSETALVSALQAAASYYLEASGAEANAAYRGRNGAFA